ncbi:MAG: DUF6084 family protein [Pseudomonadota bacterium]|nr:DUF6084 family protein [Pseudomonadota bacterium]
MPELDFQVLEIAALTHAAVPTLRFRLGIGQRRGSAAIQSIALQCQIRIDAHRRTYQPEEKARLSDLFGEPDRWSRSLQSLLWTHASVVVPGFDGERTQVELPVPCSFDFNLAATKYFHGLEQGDVPLLLLFSGSVFLRDGSGALTMEMLPWSSETRASLPVTAWRELMAHYYPNSAWLSVRQPVFDALYEYKRRHGFTGFDEALSSLLAQQTALAS